MLASMSEKFYSPQILGATEVRPFAYAISFTLNYKLGTAIKVLIAEIMLGAFPPHAGFDEHCIFEHDYEIEVGHD